MLLRLPSGPLLLTLLTLGGTIQIAALPLATIESTLMRQLPQGVLGCHMHHGFQFIGEVSRRGLGHQRGRGVQKRTVAGKEDIAASPQPPHLAMSPRVPRGIGSALCASHSLCEGLRSSED